MSKQKAMVSAIALAVIAIALPDISMAQDDQEQPTQAQRGDDELICTMEQQTGSRIRRRVCRTQADIDQEREEAAELILRTQARAAQIDRPTN